MGTNLIRAVLTSAVLSLVAACVFAALTVYGVIDMGLARFLLVLAWLAAVGGTAVSEFLLSTQRTWHRAVIITTVAVVFGAGFWGLDCWVARKKSAEVKGAHPPVQSASEPSRETPKSKRPQATASDTIRVSVPEISVTTLNGLTLSDFPSLVISSEMMLHLRRHSLTVRNRNAVDLNNLVIRFQLPEPVFGNLVIEDHPPGVEIAWHACRIPFALTGAGASTEPLAGGGTRITTGVSGAMATLYGSGEVCSASMDNDKLRPTGIYQLQIARVPAVTVIKLSFLTSNGPDGQRYIEISKGVPHPSSLNYFGDGRFQY